MSLRTNVLLMVGLATVAGACGSATSTPAELISFDQISSSGSEEVPSALRGSRTDASFPDPLIPLDQIISGGVRPDGIPPLDDPRFESVDTVSWLSAREPVVALEINGDARAYPIQIMTWHEIVNDVVGDVPVAVTYCPLCNSALVYDRRLGDRILDFGTSGELFNSSLLMYDRQTESLWTHFEAKAVVGYLAGQELETYSVQTVSWENFREAHPGGLVLSRETGFERAYGRNPYTGYDDADSVPFLFEGELDSRLAPKERIIAVRDGDEASVVLRLQDVFDAGAVHFRAHGRELVAIVEPGTASALDSSFIDQGYDQGASGVFVAQLEGRRVELERRPQGFVDLVSGSTFNVFGRATDGSGAQLEPVEHLDTFWFVLAAFDPDAQILDS